MHTIRAILFIGLLMNGHRLFSQNISTAILQQKAPKTFQAIFHTTKGDFIIEVYRDWSPAGADRLYQLITSQFYDNSVLFRVEKKFVTQFGIADNQQVNRFWDSKKLPDEQPAVKNEMGVIAYARGGMKDRTTQLFINMVNNPLLDTVVRNGLKGYTPVAKVIKGMEVVGRFFDQYGRSTLAIQDSVYKYGNRYLEVHFPGLDKIMSAKIIQ
jgi:cyclophilin family peptidyl-prolyl cis-trans isomerase